MSISVWISVLLTFADGSRSFWGRKDIVVRIHPTGSTAVAKREAGPNRDVLPVFLRVPTLASRGPHGVFEPLLELVIEALELAWTDVHALGPLLVEKLQTFDDVPYLRLDHEDE